MSVQLANLQTPALLLDRERMERNIARMAECADALGLPLRPHLKTPKSIQIAERLRNFGAARFCVSTLKEAEHFFAAGFDDLFYCAPFAPNKAARAARLVSDGCRLTLLTSTLEGAKACVIALEDASPASPVSVAVEIDVDGYRSGMRLEGSELEETARLLSNSPATCFAGLMSYAGASYKLPAQGAARLARRHAQALTDGEARLKAAGLDCAMTSLGSTPAILNVGKLRGVSEVRCGIYIFGDLFQAGIGACTLNDIALSVLTTVIEIQPRHNRLIIDAGGLALSKDRSTEGRLFDADYGRVCDVDGEPVDDLSVTAVSQELGLISSSSGSPIDYTRFKIGTMLRILPNHADMTAAAYDCYHVLGVSGELEDTGPRINHW